MSFLDYQTELDDGTLVGGEPSTAQLEKLVAAGYKKMISLRAVGESPFPATRYEQSGVAFTHLPVSSPADFSDEFLARFDEVLSSSNGPTVIFCATGNRVGAALALHAFRFRKQDARTALSIGKQGGLTRLEPFVQNWLQSQ